MPKVLYNSRKVDWKDDVPIEATVGQNKTAQARQWEDDENQWNEMLFEGRVITQDGDGSCLYHSLAAETNRVLNAMDVCYTKLSNSFWDGVLRRS